MEGTLWKWTNYISGWQQRWFVLNSGVLYYYLSESEVGQACKGSLKVASCDIMVHPNDPLRMDIIIPRERHLYLRAPSNSERQEWLVALGSMKQEDLSKENGRVELKDGGTAPELSVTDQSTCSYQDICDTAQSSLEAHKLQEISSEVSTTCDKFLNLLAECMDLTSDGKMADITRWHRLLAQNSEAFARPPLTPDLKSTNGILAGQFSVPSLPPPMAFPLTEKATPLTEKATPLATLLTEKATPSQRKPLPSQRGYLLSHRNHPHRKCNDERTLEGSSAAREEGEEERYTEFNGVCPSQQTLKLTKKYNTDPQLFVTLQSMVLQELNTNTHNEKNSSTDALLWLKRAMEFIQVFISEVAEGEQISSESSSLLSDFMNQLGSDGSAQANEAVLQDMATFAASLGHLVRLIGTFYVDHNWTIFHHGLN
eukprot:Em0913g1a